MKEKKTRRLGRLQSSTTLVSASHGSRTEEKDWTGPNDGAQGPSLGPQQGRLEIQSPGSPPHLQRQDQGVGYGGAGGAARDRHFCMLPWWS